MRPLAVAATPERLAEAMTKLTPCARFRAIEVYSFHGAHHPELLAEVGRIREDGFRRAGAGRGLAVDLDALDVDAAGYEQLVAWDPQRRQIVGMLRYQRGERALQHGLHVLRTASLFDYSSAFIKDYLPSSLELGRSVINWQASRRKLGLFALWHGLGALARELHLRYFFGNVSVYASYPAAATDILVSLVEMRHRAPCPLLVAKPSLRFVPKRPLKLPLDDGHGDGHAQRDTLTLLRQALAPTGVDVPLMMRSYLQLGQGVLFGETVVDRDFGNALEIGLIVPVRDIAAKYRGLFGL